MKYTLTKANPDADVYPAQTRQTVNDPMEDEVNKNVFMGRLEDLVHSTANWGRKHSLWPFNFGTSCCYVEYATTLTAVHDLSGRCDDCCWYLLCQNGTSHSASIRADA